MTQFRKYATHHGNGSNSDTSNRLPSISSEGLLIEAIVVAELVVIVVIVEVVVVIVVVVELIIAVSGLEIGSLLISIPIVVLLLSSNHWRNSSITLLIHWPRIGVEVVIVIEVIVVVLVLSIGILCLVDGIGLVRTIVPLSKGRGKKEKGDHCEWKGDCFDGDNPLYPLLLSISTLSLEGGYEQWSNWLRDITRDR